MSSLALHVADKRPEDPADLTGFYAGLLAVLNDAALNHHGWTGSVVADLGEIGGYVYMKIRPGEGDEPFATIEDLRAFRKRQAEEARRTEEASKQARLI
ncbi:hypothetical protein MOV76_32180 [Rhizobium sp. PRIMUS64]|uniref:hypothetical protein n=1 Tax=Rhizobium sp. PRIMUS64 TaxID=2908925 RepID=UPI001FF43873|nr:hypothetical protein [Rhizobium sp. PRIMUS64]MCJ9696231.1 hypothetical protein [Rhizobium sp. PRIMUS64]